MTFQISHCRYIEIHGAETSWFTITNVVNKAGTHLEKKMDVLYVG